MKRYRKFFTTGVGFTFLVVGTTGVIFKFFFKPHVLEEIHGWLGLAMVAAALVHIAQNWSSLLGHFRDRRVFAILIPIALTIGFFAATAKEGGRGPNPREAMRKISRANATDVARVFGKDVEGVMAAMRAGGLLAGTAQESIESIARENGKSPDEVLAYFVK
jgi:hypothetical protein